MQLFNVTRDLDSQPSSLCHLLIGETSESVLKENDEKIASPQYGMWLKMIGKLLPYFDVRGRRYYCFEGDPLTQHLLLPYCNTELAGMKSFE